MTIPAHALDTLKELAADLKTVIDKAEARQYSDSQFESMNATQLLKLIAQKDQAALGYVMRNYYQFVFSLFTRYGWTDADAEKMTSVKLMQGITAVMSTARQPKPANAARHTFTQKIIDMRESGMRFKEIAGSLGMPVRTVENRFRYHTNESFRETQKRLGKKYHKQRKQRQDKLTSADAGPGMDTLNQKLYNAARKLDDTLGRVKTNVRKAVASVGRDELENGAAK